MYCTLQEAYNVPSFTTKKKKGCMNPLSTQVDNSQSPPIAKVSADGYDSYDSYSAENGKEHALAMNLAQNAAISNSRLEQAQALLVAPPPMAQAPSYSQQSQVKPAQVNPLTPPIIGRENFDQYGSMPNSIATMNNQPYIAQSGDYQYYCNAFGICPKPPIERFENSPQPQLSTPSQQEIPQTQRYPQVAGPTPASMIFSADGSMGQEFPGQIQTPYYGSNPMGKCAPLQGPAYELPINPAQRAQASQALNVAIDQTQGATERLTYPMRRVDMAKVSGYYDEELENFLTTQSAKSQPLPPAQTPKSPDQVTAELVKSTATMPTMPTMPTTPTMPTMSTMSTAPTALTTPTTSMSPSVSSFKYIQSPQYIMDLMLFIAAGILVILLCDQIFKLGMSFGMRDTVKVLMPYLQELKITEG